MKGCVLIPTFNESRIIYELVLNIKKYNLDVIVIDDGSRDDTKALSMKAGAEVIVHSKNMGKGASLRSGFQRVLDRDYDFIITMDGDGQHHPDDLVNFLDFYSKDTAEILVGNRMQQPQNMPYLRWFTNRIMSMLISSLCKKYIPDTQCGFRLIKKNVLKDIVVSTSNYEIESEILIQASKKKYRIESVPIKTIYEGQDSQIHPVIDTVRFLKFLFKDCIKEGRAILKELFQDIIIKQSSIIFLSSLLSNIFSLIFWLFMIRKLNHIEYGVLNSMVSLLALLGLPASVLQTVLARYFSEFKALDQKERMQALFRAFLKRITVINFIIIAVFLAFANKITIFLHLKSEIFVYFSALSMFCSILSVLTISAMQGLQLFGHIAINSILQGFVKISAGIVFVLSGLRALGGFLGFVLSALLGFIFSLFQLPSWLFKMKNKEYSFYKPEIKIREIYGYFIPTSLSLFAYTLFINTDMILVKHFFSESEAGIYSIAQTVGKIILFLPSAITVVFFPVSIEHKTQKKNILPLLKRSLFFMSILSCFAILFTFIFPRFMLRVISGKVLVESISLVRFIIFPMSLFALSYIFIFYNLSLKNMRFILSIFIISILQVIFICFFHDSLFEVVGILLIFSLLSFYLGLKSISKDLNK